MKRAWRGFTGRMILGALVIQALLIPLLFYGILFFIERGFQSQFVDQVRGNAYLYANLLAAAASGTHQATSRATLDEAMLDEDLLMVEFLRSDGTVVRPSGSGRATRPVFRQDFQFAQHGDGAYFIAMPVVAPATGEQLGLLRIGYDESPTARRIASAYGFGSVLAAGYVLLSLAMVIFFSHRLVRPLRQLRDRAAEIQGGDRATALQVNTSLLEIEQLAAALEKMRRRLVEQHAGVRDRERRLHAILDNAGEGILSFDSKGVLRSYNRAAESIFGYSSAEAIGSPIARLIPPLGPTSDAEFDTGVLSRFMAGNAESLQQLQARNREGRTVPIGLTVTEVRVDHQTLYIGIVRDLSTRFEHERQLLKFQRVVEQSPVSIIITDTNGSIEYVNPHFCRVTGYRPAEVLGENPRILKSGYTNADNYRNLWETITRGDVWHGIFQNRRKNGEVFWESATICPVHDPDHAITHYIALKEDITEHRRKDRMLTQAMKLEVVGRMTDGIAHDFNNLLTIIMGNLQCLQEEIGPQQGEESAEVIADALSAATDGADLIRQLLVFARREDPVFKPVDIVPFMRTVRLLLKRALPEDIVMSVSVAEQIGPVQTDRIRLESAVLNLAINSRDAMPEGGTLAISARSEHVPEIKELVDGWLDPGDYALIEVTDNGTGMEEHVLNRAIEPFFTTKAHTSGTGLGLSMVNDLVTQSGGGMRIESTPGRGTSVTLYLPLSEETAPSEDIDSRIEEQLPRGRERILVVEDRTKVRRYARRVLGRLGYRVFEADSADGALPYLQSDARIDLLFTDIVMPGSMDGLQLANFAVSCQPSLKVLLTTGIKFDAASAAQASHDFQLLPKPYSMTQLAHAVRDLLDTDKAR